MNSGSSVSVANRPPPVAWVTSPNMIGPATPASFSLTE